MMLETGDNACTFASSRAVEKFSWIELPLVSWVSGPSFVLMGISKHVKTNFSLPEVLSTDSAEQSNMQCTDLVLCHHYQ